MVGHHSRDRQECQHCLAVGWCRGCAVRSCRATVSYVTSHYRVTTVSPDADPSRRSDSRRSRQPGRRSMGVLFVLSGGFFVAGVLNPPILPTWGESVADVLSTAAVHRTAWFASTWLITLAIVAGLAAFELLARTLDTGMARVGAVLYVVGGALGLASTTYDLAVSSTQIGSDELPDWYLGVQQWADGLGTAYFALLAPAAMTCAGVAILRTRVLPVWEGFVLLAGAVLLLGQFAVFQGALPAPQFLAFIAIGIGALTSRSTRKDMP
jgi:hypothetical protein